MRSWILGIGKAALSAVPENYSFPRLRIRDVEQGELLCRVGYPFVEGIHLDWTEVDGFKFSNLFPMPVFVNEALVSRFLQIPQGLLIETSSPGLKGQSGGPLLDVDGNVCGLQVSTAHYPLDFEGKGRNQVLNVGRAVHVNAICSALDDHAVTYYREDMSNG